MNENEKTESVQNADGQISFLDALKKTNSSYLTLVIICAFIAICGIIITLVLHLLWLGITIAFSSAIVYMLFTKVILLKNLGISYQTTSGQLTVTKLCAKDKSEIFVPRRLLWLNVTRLESRAFECSQSDILTEIHLPDTIMEIGENAFEGCSSLKKIYFQGNREKWESIDNQTDFTAFELIFCDNSEYELKKQTSPKSVKDELEDKG